MQIKLPACTFLCTDTDGSFTMFMGQPEDAARAKAGLDEREEAMSSSEVYQCATVRSV